MPTPQCITMVSASCHSKSVSSLCALHRADALRRGHALTLTFLSISVYGAPCNLALSSSSCIGHMLIVNGLHVLEIISGPSTRILGCFIDRTLTLQ